MAVMKLGHGNARGISPNTMQEDQRWRVSRYEVTWSRVMTNCLNTRLIGVLSLCLFAADIRAGKGPTDVLADQADAVVVGNIQSGQQNGQSLAFMLSVVRTI